MTTKQEKQTAQTKHSANGQKPDILQGIINGVPQTDDEVLLVEYLTLDSTINEAVKLKPNQLTLLEAQLKQLGYKAGTLRTWVSQVKARKKQAANANQPAEPSHLDIAEMYIKVMGKATIYTRSDWHRYKDGVWSILPELFFNQEVLGLFKTLEAKHEKKFTASDLNSVSAFIASRLAIKDEEMDSNPNLVNMENGVFDIKSQILMPHEPEYYQTSQLPFEYDAVATCPSWHKFLQTTLVKWNEETRKWETDQELVQFLQEAMGYSLTSSVEYQIMFWCLGGGANGKGVFFHIFQALAGDASMPLDIGGLRQNAYQLAMLAGKKIAYSAEAERNADMVSDGVIKSLVAGDPIMVRQIREKPFKLCNTSKLWWSMNRMPKINDTSHGFWRRVKAIPFSRIFTDDEIVTDLKEKLEEELSGIFNWAMNGWQRVRANGEFTEPSQVTELTLKHRRESNPVQMFVEEECSIDPAFETMTITPLYQAYKAWCADGNYKPFSRKNFKNELAELGHSEERKTAGTVIVGLELKPKKASPWTVNP